MRKFIDLMESIKDDNLVDHIAEMVSLKHHEGFSPYWKLNADPRILEDSDAMLHIAGLISSGFTSGHNPTWDLTVLEGDDLTDDEEDHMARHATTHGEIEESEDAPCHKVVSVYQKEGQGMGWWECPHEDAELHVVEDHEGNPVESYHDRNSAEAHAHALNNQILDEDTESHYSGSPDHEVEVAYIHEKGALRDHARAELERRGIDPHSLPRVE